MGGRLNTDCDVNPSGDKVRIMLRGGGGAKEKDAWLGRRIGEVTSGSATPRYANGVDFAGRIESGGVAGRRRAVGPTTSRFFSRVDSAARTESGRPSAHIARGPPWFGALARGGD